MSLILVSNKTDLTLTSLKELYTFLSVFLLLRRANISLTGYSLTVP